MSDICMAKCVDGKGLNRDVWVSLRHSPIDGGIYLDVRETLSEHHELHTADKRSNKRFAQLKNEIVESIINHSGVGFDALCEHFLCRDDVLQDFRVLDFRDEEEKKK